MTVVDVAKDPVALTLVLVSEFAATPEQLWEVWENPRVLERWWGPPTYPAAFTRHEFHVGGESRYCMTGPEGEKSRGWWRMQVLEKPHRLEFLNGLAGDNGEPMPGVEPMHCVVTIERIENGTRMTTASRFTDEEQMGTMLDMGMEEGMAQALGQIDALLSA